MSNRDDFSPKIKLAVALRAGHRCSLCSQPTVGPSDEAPHAVTMIGEAAHIHAAASGIGARRYLASMAAEERSDISNAIWLCANHARMIDRDETTYPAEALVEIKRAHEIRCANELKTGSETVQSSLSLVAIGPNVVCVGDIISGDDLSWTISICNFIEGDINILLMFIEIFANSEDYDRYVLVNSIGDGRVLRSAPRWIREGSKYTVQCPIFPAFPRIRAADLPTDLAVSENHDLVFAKGNLATVAGLEALPQKIRMNLSLQRGESAFHKNYGTRIASYYKLLYDSPWFTQLIKLEVIRLAAIPYPDVVSGKRYLPFQCVQHVFSVDLLADADDKGWLPLQVDLTISGIGRWQHETSVYIKEHGPRPSIEDIIDGKF